MPVTCSARDCRADACWSLLWNNPKLHTPDRRKTWLACEEHRGSLSDFLSARGFLRDVEPLADDLDTGAESLSGTDPGGGGARRDGLGEKA